MVLKVIRSSGCWRWLIFGRVDNYRANFADWGRGWLYTIHTYIQHTRVWVLLRRGAVAGEIHARNMSHARLLRQFTSTSRLLHLPPYSLADSYVYIEYTYGTPRRCHSLRGF